MNTVARSFSIKAAWFFSNFLEEARAAHYFADNEAMLIRLSSLNLVLIEMLRSYSYKRSNKKKVGRVGESSSQFTAHRW